MYIIIVTYNYTTIYEAWYITNCDFYMCGPITIPQLRLTPSGSGVPRGGLGVQTPPPPKFLRYRWNPRSHEQEEPASRFPSVDHCVLIRL